MRGLFFLGGAGHPRESMTLRAPRRDHGFSLAELILVLGVTAIVAGLALSAYRTYSARAQVATGIVGVKRIRHAIEETFRRTGMPPSTFADLGTLSPNSSDLVDSIRVENGRIELTFSHAADSALSGQSLYLTPFETVDQRIVWICGNRVPSVGLNLLGFAGGTSQAEQTPTRIEPRFLPPTCR